MLKFKEMTGRLTEEEKERWESIQRTFSRNVQLAGIGDDAKFGQMIVQLTSFSDGLDAIRKTLDSGVGRLLESEAQAAEQEQAPPEETAVTASFDAETLDAMRQLVEQMRSAATEETSLTASFDAETLDAIRQLIEQMKSAVTEAVAQAAPPATAAQQPEIHLVSKVPRSILNILREQFRIMHTWLEPLHRESLRQNKELAGLQKTLSGSMEKYDLLIKRLEEAIQRGDLTYETLAKNKVRSERARKAKKKGPP